MKHSITLTLLALLCASCGQKGPLYLPPPEPAATTPPPEKQPPTALPQSPPRLEQQ